MSNLTGLLINPLGQVFTVLIRSLRPTQRLGIDWLAEQLILLVGTGLWIRTITHCIAVHFIVHALSICFMDSTYFKNRGKSVIVKNGN